jgi:acyl carrier protein
VKQVIVRALDLAVPAEEIGDDEVLFGVGLGADSLAALQILFALEEEFDLRVEDEELRVELFESVRSLTEYVERRAGPSGADVSEATAPAGAVAPPEGTAERGSGAAPHLDRPRPAILQMASSRPFRTA